MQTGVVFLCWPPRLCHSALLLVIFSFVFQTFSNKLSHFTVNWTWLKEVCSSFIHVCWEGREAVKIDIWDAEHHWQIQINCYLCSLTRQSWQTSLWSNIEWVKAGSKQDHRWPNQVGASVYSYRQPNQALFPSLRAGKEVGLTQP